MLGGVFPMLYGMGRAVASGEPQLRSWVMAVARHPGAGRRAVRAGAGAVGSIQAYSVSRGMTLTVAKRACAWIIGLRYGLPRYFLR